MPGCRGMVVARCGGKQSTNSLCIAREFDSNGRFLRFCLNFNVLNVIPFRVMSNRACAHAPGDHSMANPKDQLSRTQ